MPQGTRPRPEASHLILCALELSRASCLAASGYDMAAQPAGHWLGACAGACVYTMNILEQICPRSSAAGYASAPGSEHAGTFALEPSELNPDSLAHKLTSH